MLSRDYGMHRRFRPTEGAVMSRHCDDVPLDEAIRCFDISPIIERYGSWAVTEFGVECLETQYFIPLDEVREPNWINQMRGKVWVNLFDFIRALHHAKRLANRPKRMIRSKVLKRDGYCCQICGRAPSDGVKLEVDHKHPKAKGGSNDLNNLWTLCEDCNQGKSDELS